MAFKEIAGGETRYPKYAECDDGDLIVEGTFKGTSEGKFGVQYMFTDKEGPVVLGKAGHLDYLMSQVDEGSLVQVVYGGSEVMTKGAYAGKSAHRFKVLVDDEASGGTESFC